MIAATTSSPFCLALLELHPPLAPTTTKKHKRHHQTQYPTSSVPLHWRTRRIVLHTAGVGTPAQCATLIDQVCPELVQKRRNAALNQHLTTSPTLPEKACAPLHSIVKGSTVLVTREDGQSSHASTYSAVVQIRATYALFYEGALALVCLDTQRNAFPSSHLVDYGVSAVRTCLATLPSKYNQLKDRIEKKYSELWFLLKRTLVTQERSTWLATKRLVNMTLSGRGPLHRRSSLRTQTLPTSIPNDIVCDYSSDVWQDPGEDAGPSRWLDIHMEMFQEQDHATVEDSTSLECMENAMARMGEVYRKRERRGGGNKDNGSIDGGNGDYESTKASFALRSSNPAKPTSRSTRSESTLWGNDSNNGGNDSGSLDLDNDWGDEKSNDGGENSGGGGWVGVKEEEE